MNYYRPLVLFLGSAAISYIASTQRNAKPSTGNTQPPDEYRNRGFRFRSVGQPGEPYPDWVRALQGKSGVYVFRELDENGEPGAFFVGAATIGSLVGKRFDRKGVVGSRARRSRRAARRRPGA